MGPYEKPSVPFDMVHVNHLGSFVRGVQDNSCVLMLVDGFTKFTVGMVISTLCLSEAIDKLGKLLASLGTQGFHQQDVC